MSLEDRVLWLRQVMAGSWRSVTPELAEWREACIATVGALAADTVIFSHYVAINVLAGSATGDDRVVNFSPENCSVTTFDVSNGKLSLIEKGTEAPLTKVN
jgi:broad specificity phosphatase PhoE